MQDRTCSIDGCEKPAKTRGWCRMHYIRFNRHGNPLGFAPKPTLWERVDAKIIRGEGCWEWTGAHHPAGYPHLRVNSGKSGSTALLVHREVFAHFHGPIPDGLLIDHVCHNKGCVNPDHMRLATSKQNNENQRGLRKSNTSGYMGVHRTRSGRWEAAVTHNGVTYRAGRFDTAADAGEAARKLRLKLFTHNDHDRGGLHESERARCDR